MHFFTQADFHIMLDVALSVSFAKTVEYFLVKAIKKADSKIKTWWDLDKENNL